MQEGAILDGKYRVIKALGQGGMGKVYLAENMNLGTLWAIKEITRTRGLDMAFPAEPDILKKLDHPALPRIFDVIEDHDSIYIVFEYIQGQPLDRKLAEEGRFPESCVVQWAIQLCGVLDYLHSLRPNPIIYRDMKPSNLILTASGSLKLIDFGTAREYKAENMHDTVYIGTRGYAAPEQYGTGQTDATTDIYSLGVTLYQLLTGKSPNEPPYEIKPVRSLDDSLSDEIERILSKCTKQNPAERYQTARELQKDFETLEGKSRSTWDAGSLRADGPHYTKTGSAFKKLVLTIWGNAEFGCEFAYQAARMSHLDVLLVDLDLLAPKADLFLQLKKYPERIANEGVLGKSGLNIAIDCAGKNVLSLDLLKDAAIRRRELRNLFVLTGNYRLENYEYFREESLVKLIDKAYQGFDLTVLLVNRCIYDAYTAVSLIKSDYNLAVIRADLDQLREFNSYLVFLKEKQHIPLSKTKFVAFEYDHSLNLASGDIRGVTDDSYMGGISYSRKRVLYRSRNSPYVRHMEQEVVREYMNLLRYFHILPAPGFLASIRQMVNRLQGRGEGSAGCQDAPSADL